MPVYLLYFAYPTKFLIFALKNFLSMKQLLFVLFAFPLFVTAQNKPLVAEGVYPSLYVNHTVLPKENYYSIGRIYNISPKEIAPFNNLELENGLSLNQTIKIPLLANNFLQEGNALEDEVLVPVYHTVQGKEGLYRVSMNYNKLPVETILKWNNLKDPSVSNGTNLVIGFIKVKKALSPLAAMAVTKPAGDIAKTGTPAKAADESKVVNGETEATVQAVVPPLKEKEPVAEAVKKAPDPVVVKEKEPVKTITTPVTRKSFKGGAFKTDYDKQVKSSQVASEFGQAAIFKSTSGWEDGKYYCLHNSSAPGTIIKITNTSNGKNIYAKVLDVIPDMKQNSGLLVRLSNAAADELGAGETKFNCTLNYSK